MARRTRSAASSWPWPVPWPLCLHSVPSAGAGSTRRSGERRVVVKRLVRERGRLLLGSALLLAAVIILGVAYASIADEIIVAIQLPYILGGGVSALLCAGIGLLLIRSQDETRNRDRLV